MADRITVAVTASENGSPVASFSIVFISSSSRVVVRLRRQPWYRNRFCHSRCRRHEDSKRRRRGRQQRATPPPPGQHPKLRQSPPHWAQTISFGENHRRVAAGHDGPSLYLYNITVLSDHTMTDPRNRAR